MLRKLLKYDLLFGRTTFLVMAGLALLLAFLLPWVESLHLGVLSQILEVVAILILVPVGIISVVLVIQLFVKNLFGAQGYLMHTLPVKARTLLSSKLLTTVIWFNFMLFTGVIAVGLFMRNFNFLDFQSQADFWRMVMIWLDINMVVVSMTLCVYVGIALANSSFNGRRLGYFWGVGAMIVLQYIQNAVLNEVARALLMQDITVQGGLIHLNWSIILVSTVFGAAYYFATLFLVKRRIHLS